MKENTDHVMRPCFAVSNQVADGVNDILHRPVIRIFCGRDVACEIKDTFFKNEPDVGKLEFLR